MPNGPGLQGDGYEIRVSDEYVPCEDRRVPSWLEVELSGDDEQPSVIGRVEVRGGVPEVVEVRFVSRPGEREVRQADLRRVETSALIMLAAGYSVRVTDSTVEINLPDDEGNSDALDSLLRARAGNGVRQLTPQFLQRVAEIYRENINNRPTDAVRRHFVVAPRTASEYVQRARRAGLLPKTSPGKKKA